MEPQFAVNAPQQLHGPHRGEGGGIASRTEIDDGIRAHPGHRRPEDAISDGQGGAGGKLGGMSGHVEGEERGACDRVHRWLLPIIRRGESAVCTRKVN